MIGPLQLYLKQISRLSIGMIPLYDLRAAWRSQNIATTSKLKFPIWKKIQYYQYFGKISVSNGGPGWLNELGSWIT